MRPIACEYLELACYGMTDAEIAKRYGVQQKSVRITLLNTAREVGRIGFWKFDVLSSDMLRLLAPQLLDKMHRHGLLTRREAA